MGEILRFAQDDIVRGASRPCRGAMFVREDRQPVKALGRFVFVRMQRGHRAGARIWRPVHRRFRSYRRELQPVKRGASAPQVT
jgi:hypothetical protein